MSMEQFEILEIAMIAIGLIFLFIIKWIEIHKY